MDIPKLVFKKWKLVSFICQPGASSKRIICKKRNKVNAFFCRNVMVGSPDSGCSMLKIWRIFVGDGRQWRRYGWTGSGVRYDVPRIFWKKIFWHYFHRYFFYYSKPYRSRCNRILSFRIEMLETLQLKKTKFRKVTFRSFSRLTCWKLAFLLATLM